MNSKLPYAEDVSYWKTSKSSPDTWVSRTVDLITELGGVVTAEAYGSDSSGRGAFMVAFSMQGENFKLVWPVLESKTGDIKAARRQAATSLYHYTKGAALRCVVMGSRAAFFEHLLLHDGRTASQIKPDELVSIIEAPKFALLESGQ